MLRGWSTSPDRQLEAKTTGKLRTKPADDETREETHDHEVVVHRELWTQDEIQAAIAKAMEDEPDGPDRDYWTSNQTRIRSSGSTARRSSSRSR